MSCLGRGSAETKRCQVPVGQGAQLKGVCRKVNREGTGRSLAGKGYSEGAVNAGSECGTENWRAKLTIPNDQLGSKGK